MSPSLPPDAPDRRRIHRAPLYKNNVLSRLREKLLAKDFVMKLRRFRRFWSLTQWLWRNGYPLYVRCLFFVRVPALPLVRLSELVRQPAVDIITLAGAEIVEAPSPEVFPAKDRGNLASPHDRYAFPDIFVVSLGGALVTGETNLVATGKQVVCHDLYDFPRDFTSEEMHGRTVILPGRNRVRWLVEDAERALVPAAASFVDACASNYAHWMTEVLPRIGLLCSDDRFSSLPIIVNAGLHQNIMESLRLVVRDPARTILTLPIARTLRVTRLFVVSPAGYVPFGRRTNRLTGHSHGKFSPHALQSLARMAKAHVQVEGGGLPRRIFIRRNSGTRTVVNAAEIERLLVERGFSVVEPEKLNFVEQVEIFSRAEVIVGATGAAFANLIFCRPAARIVIMLSKDKNMPYWYWQNMACSVGCRVTYVLGKAVRFSFLGIHRDFHVNPRDVLDAIEFSA